MDEEQSSSVEDNAKHEHHHKWLNEGKFLIRVDSQKYQAEVPLKIEKSLDELLTTLRMESKISRTVHQDDFKGKLDDYLIFAQSLMSTEGKPSGIELQLHQTDFKRGQSKRTIYAGDGSILSGSCTSLEQINEKALDFLQKVEYNFTKAKFYLLFPTMMIYNKFAPRNQIILSEEQMLQQIQNYISILNEDKLGLELKWKQEISDMVSRKPKIYLNQLQHYIEQGQQLKYELPENIRAVVAQAHQVSKSLTKIIRNQEKQTISQLSASLETFEESIPVITTELTQLKEIVSKVNVWVERVRNFSIPWRDDDEEMNEGLEEEIFQQLLNCPQMQEKISLKSLKNQVVEYKSLPIQSQWFENVHKRLFDYVKDLVEKLGKTVGKVTQSKTRSAQTSIVVVQDRGDKMSLRQAQDLANQINNVAVSCEEYQYFIDQYEESREVYERCCMYLQDCKRDTFGFFKVIQGLLKEVLECCFLLDVQDKLQDLSDYITAFEHIKKTLNQNKMEEAYKEIQEAKERGFCSNELLQLESVLERILEWNQKSEALLNPSETLEMIAIYLNKVTINANGVEFSDLLPVNKDIVDFIERAKIVELQELQQKSNSWSHQLKQFLEQRVSTRKNMPKSLTILWDLIKEGHKYYRHEKALLQRGITIFTNILDWAAQTYSLQQNYKSYSNTQMQVEGQDSLIDIIGHQCLQKILQEKQETRTQTAASLHKLLKSATLFVVGTFEFECLENLIMLTEKWDQEAESIIQQQTPFSVSSSVIQYDSNICKLLQESKTLPINTHLVSQLNGIYEANKKATHILSIINHKESILEPLLKMMEDAKYRELQKDLNNVIANQGDFTPSKKKIANTQVVSFVAKQFYQTHLTTIMDYLNEIVKLDPQKFKKVTQSHIRLNKLKEISNEFSIHCQNCPTILNEGFELVRQQLNNNITNYVTWQNQLQSLLCSEDSSQQKQKKKRSVKKQRNDGSENESVVQESSNEYTTPHLRGEMLYYFKVPDILCLFLEAVQQSFVCPDTFDAWKFLECQHGKIREALNILQNCDKTRSPKDIQLYQSQVYLPQFHVLRKLQELTQQWIATASYMVNQTPRAKNLYVKSKMKSFIDHINTVQPQCEQQMMIEEISSEEDDVKKNEKRATKQIQKEDKLAHHKPKREKKISILMQDKNMAFYDPNASLKKAFGNGSAEKQPKLDAEKPSAQKNRKNKKLWQKLKVQKQEARRGKDKTKKLTEQTEDVQLYNPQFLQRYQLCNQWVSFKDSSQELQALYIYDKPYCICRQGGESQITDWNILKCMQEQKVTDFFLLHLKLQESKKIMVCCDTCNEWFHQECIGIKTHQMKLSDKYSCRVCVLRQQPIFLIGTRMQIDQMLAQKATKETTDLFNLQQIYLKQNAQLEEILSNAGDIFYNRYQKTTLHSFREFINLGRKIPLYIIELEALELIYDKILKWLDRSQHQISLYNLRNDTQITNILSLFSESLWFPVYLEESDKLLQMIHQIEFERKAQEVLQGKRSFLGKGKVIKKALVDRTLLLYDYLGEVEDKNELHLIKILDTLKTQQDLNSSLERQIQMLTHNNAKLQEYQDLWDRFEGQIRSHQTNFPFVVTKHIELKEKILKAKGLEIKLIHYFQSEMSAQVLLQNQNQDSRYHQDSMNE